MYCKNCKYQTKRNYCTNKKQRAYVISVFDVIIRDDEKLKVADDFLCHYFEKKVFFRRLLCLH